jgi:hypothetical protein
MASAGVEYPEGHDREGKCGEGDHVAARHVDGCQHVEELAEAHGRSCLGGGDSAADQSSLTTTRTVAAPAPNLVCQLLRHSVQCEMASLPSSASVVPAWSQDTMRSASVSQITVKVNCSSDPGPDGSFDSTAEWPDSTTSFHPEGMRHRPRLAWTIGAQEERG